MHVRICLLFGFELGGTFLLSGVKILRSLTVVRSLSGFYIFVGAGFDRVADQCRRWELH